MMDNKMLFTWLSEKSVTKKHDESSSFDYPIHTYIYIVHKRVLNYHIYKWKEQNNYVGEKWKH